MRRLPRQWTRRDKGSLGERTAGAHPERRSDVKIKLLLCAITVAGSLLGLSGCGRLLNARRIGTSHRVERCRAMFVLAISSQGQAGSVDGCARHRTPRAHLKPHARCCAVLHSAVAAVVW
ncbi:hypothetical protein MRB53_037327 [Persea americana]|nr:hypothetical protein MRB53_037327 [Persea americana]